MRVHYLQHVFFEGIGFIEELIKHHEVTKTELYKNDRLPEVLNFDCLIVMGGPMSIKDDQLYPWLAKERLFIKKVIEANIKVVGICLGAQLLADALHAKVFSNPVKEIGWFSFEKSLDLESTILKGIFNDSEMVFHWHGDTFDIPSGAINIGRSNGCIHQGFIYKNQVIGLQFHLEMTEMAINAILKNCEDEIICGLGLDTEHSIYIQDQSTILGQMNYVARNNELMTKILNVLGVM